MNELRAVVEELVADVESLHQRTITRARREQMNEARQVHETKKARQTRIEEEALAIIERKQQQPPPPSDPEQLREQLRLRHLAHLSDLGRKGH